MSSNKGQIIPFCIYHRDDSNTQTYLGFISGPQKVLKKNGDEEFICAPEPKTYRQWFLYDTFYALSPSYRPIPNGMLLFCAKRSDIYPYDISEIKFVYDSFNIKDDCIYFITYSQPMINTVPLYLHKSGSHVYPSFKKNPPSDNPGWTQEEISPIFVMTKDTVGDIYDKNTDIKFKCVNDRCIPWKKNTFSNIYLTDENIDSELLDLDKCALVCNRLKNQKTLNIIDMVKLENKKIVNKFSKTTIFIVFLLVIMTFTLIIVLYSKYHNV